MRAIGFAALLWLVASGASASDAAPPCAPHVELRRVELSVKGRPGIWFDMEVAKCLLADAAEAVQLRALTEEQGARIVSAADLQAMTDQMLAMAIEEANLAREGQALAIKTRNEAERQLRSPGRSRGLWFAVGLVSGVIVVGLSAYTLSVVR